MENSETVTKTDNFINRQHKQKGTANVHTMIYVHLGHLASGAMIHTEYDFWNGVASVV
jgi:hypothetical protein